MMLTVSQQKYLQVIDILEQEQGVVRQIDVAVYLGYPVPVSAVRLKA